MFKAGDAKKKRREAVERMLNERVIPMIEEACDKGENCIYTTLTEEEAEMLRDAGYTVVVEMNFNKVSW